MEKFYTAMTYKQNCVCKNKDCKIVATFIIIITELPFEFRTFQVLVFDWSPESEGKSLVIKD